MLFYTLHYSRTQTPSSILRFTEFHKVLQILPALRLQRDMSATVVHTFVSGLYASTLFLTSGPSWPPTAYKIPSITPTPNINKILIHIIYYFIFYYNKTSYLDQPGMYMQHSSIYNTNIYISTA